MGVSLDQSVPLRFIPLLALRTIWQNLRPSQQKPILFAQLSNFCQHYLQCLKSGHLKFQLNQDSSFKIIALDSQASKKIDYNIAQPHRK